MDIESQYDQIARCNRCGFCQTACPIFRSTGHEAGVARGRIALLRALIEERIPWDTELEEPLFNCLLCGACTTHCFPALPTADLVLAARRQYLDRVGRGPLHKLLFHHVLPSPKRLRLAAKAAAFGKRTGLTKLAKSLGLLRIFGRDFPRAEEIIDRFPKKAFRETVPPGVMEGEGQLRIAYFVGCGTDLMCPDAARATLRLLRKIAKTVRVLDNCCCGLPAASYGDPAAAGKLAEANLTRCRDDQLDWIVVDCSSCAAFLKRYPELFAEDDARHRRARAFAERVRDVVELIESQGLAASSHDGGDGKRVVVTYHDPCHAVRGQGLTAEPRKILRSMAGVEYRELAEADWCCGGAGSYALSHYDLARQVLDRKMDHVARSGADVLATSCPACIVHLSYGVRKRGLPVRVCHLSEVVAGEEEARD
ncbi:MAG: (Fe-S)-binding protein [Planctomycetota bacterium]|jgi:glycolate oxidase iron-sulfur subunit